MMDLRQSWHAFLARKPDEIATTWIGVNRRSLLPGWLDYLAAANAGISGAFGAMDRVTAPPALAVQTFAAIRERFAGLATATNL